jgi:tetratricopeptide (TPR) repeat protein
LTLRAHHVGNAIQLGDEQAAELLTTAAVATLGTAPSTSARWARAALWALPERSESADRRAELRLLYANALSLSGNLDQSRAVLREVIAATEGPRRHAAVCLLAHLERLLGQHNTANALLNAELAALDAGNGAEPLLRMELAANEMMAGHWRDGMTQASLVVKTARRSGHHVAESAATTVLAVCAMATEPFSTAQVRLAEAQCRFDDLDDACLHDDRGGIALLALAEANADQHARALAHVQRGLELTHRYGRTDVTSQLYVVRAFLRWQSGFAHSCGSTDPTRYARWWTGSARPTRLARRCIRRSSPHTWRRHTS